MTTAFMALSSMFDQTIRRRFHHGVIHHAMAQIGHDLGFGDAQHHRFAPLLKTGEEKTGARGDGADPATGSQQFQPPFDKDRQQVVFAARIGFGELIFGTGRQRAEDDWEPPDCISAYLHLTVMWWPPPFTAARV